VDSFQSHIAFILGDSCWTWPLPSQPGRLIALLFFCFFAALEVSSSSR
jgi:hypothetical protein